MEQTERANKISEKIENLVTFVFFMNLWFILSLFLLLIFVKVTQFIVHLSRVGSRDAYASKDGIVHTP